jgi:hypothetical protein
LLSEESLAWSSLLSSESVEEGEGEEGWCLSWWKWDWK